MSQTVTQNSALSQNWVRCTRCTPWLRLRAQAERTAPRPAVLQPMAGRVAGLPCRVAGWPLPRTHCASCCAPSAVSYASCVVSWLLPGPVAALYRDTASCQTSPCHDTTDCIVTHSPTARPSARVASRPRALGWPCRRLYRSPAVRVVPSLCRIVACLGRIMAESPAPAARYASLCHDTKIVS